MAYVVIGMSGGVDSSVAAYLLKQQGHNVCGVFMKNWEEDDTSEYCSSRQDWLDAVSVADKIGIDIEAINLSQDYQNSVFKHFIDSYVKGHTPNPDVFCNSEIKFKGFLENALSMGADYMATGHYADIIKLNHNNKEYFALGKALDHNKDQSYFLYRLNQYQLSKSLFPLGKLHKPQVREIAKNLGLHNALKKDSTGICFIGKRPFREFLSQYISNKPGLILDDKGNHIGNHIGLSFYTIGQRKGIGIGGIKNNNNTQPWFIAKKDNLNNILYAVQGHQHPWLLSKNVNIENIVRNENYLNNINNNNDNVWQAKTRYRQKSSNCIANNLSALHWWYTHEQELNVKFMDEQWAVTSGQSLVLYHNDICIGGGIISNYR